MSLNNKPVSVAANQKVNELLHSLPMAKILDQLTRHQHASLRERKPTRLFGLLRERVQPPRLLYRGHTWASPSHKTRSGIDSKYRAFASPHIDVASGYGEYPLPVSAGNQFAVNRRVSVMKASPTQAYTPDWGIEKQLPPTALKSLHPGPQTRTQLYETTLGGDNKVLGDLVQLRGERNYRRIPNTSKWKAIRDSIFQNTNLAD